MNEDKIILIRTVGGKEYIGILHSLSNQETVYLSKAYEVEDRDGYASIRSVSNTTTCNLITLHRYQVLMTSSEQLIRYDILSSYKSTIGA